MEERPRRTLPVLAAAIILAFFAFFTWRGLGTYFDNDDMMNLHQAWIGPWSELLKANVLFWTPFYRPMGGLFYRVLFSLAGFHPGPFRLACLALGVANMGLFWWLARLLLPTGRAVALSALLFAFHSRVMEIWFRTATIYDLIGFTFFYLAVCLYIRARRQGAMPDRGTAVAILLCYVAALDSKEMVVVLPVVLLLWEVLVGRPAWKSLWLLGALAGMTVVFIAGKLGGSNALQANNGYQLEFSGARFVQNWASYWTHIFLERIEVGPVRAVLFLLVPLGVALARKARLFIWAWMTFIMTVMPVIFASARGGYVLYLGLPGLAICAALVLDEGQELLAARRPAWRLPLACLVFVLVGWRYGKATFRDQKKDKRWLYESPALVRGWAEALPGLRSHWKPGVRILLLDDPFGDDEWTPTFTARLFCNDRELWIDRPKMMKTAPKDWNEYDAVVVWEDQKYRALKP